MTLSCVTAKSIPVLWLVPSSYTTPRQSVTNQLFINVKEQTTKLKEWKVRLGDKWSKSFGNYAIKLSAEETKWMARVPEPPSLFFTVWF